jgi:hypothetical protein
VVERGEAEPVGAAASPVRLRVLIPGLLRSYSGGAPVVELQFDPRAAAAGPEGASAAAPSVAAALAELDRRFPGLRFRLVDEQGGLRPHIRLFLDASEIRRLDAPLPPAGELMIVGALSGG